jgi:hypothetical protein
MNAHKIAIKFYAESDGGLTDHDFVPVLHTWIQQHAVADHMLIDVAEYAHVHDGPGTLLVAHEANFYLDRMDGQVGLTYSRKQPLAGSTNFAERLKQAVITAVEACQRLENAPQLGGKLQFRTNEFALFINDRLLAPNDDQTFARVRADVEEIAAKLYAGAPADVEHYPSAETVFEVHVRANDSANIATLLKRLGA